MLDINEYWKKYVSFASQIIFTDKNSFIYLYSIEIQMVFQARLSVKDFCFVMNGNSTAPYMYSLYTIQVHYLSLLYKSLILDSFALIDFMLLFASLLRFTFGDFSPVSIYFPSLWPCRYRFDPRTLFDQPTTS